MAQPVAQQSHASKFCATFPCDPRQHHKDSKQFLRYIKKFDCHMKQTSKKLLFQIDLQMFLQVKIVDYDLKQISDEIIKEIRQKIVNFFKYFHLLNSRNNGMLGRMDHKMS